MDDVDVVHVAPVVFAAPDTLAVVVNRRRVEDSGNLRDGRSDADAPPEDAPPGLLFRWNRTVLQRVERHFVKVSLGVGDVRRVAGEQHVKERPNLRTPDFIINGVHEPVVRDVVKELREVGLQDEAFAAVVPAILTEMPHQPRSGECHALPFDACPIVVD